MLKFFIVVILSFQLSVYARADVIDDAQNALNWLDSQIQFASNVVSTTAPEWWRQYSTNISEAFNRGITNDVQQFRDVISNIALTVNYIGIGHECMDLLLSSSGLVQNIFASEELVYSSLLGLAAVELINSENQYADLNAQFFTNCVADNINCEGISNAIVADVNRRVPLVRKIAFDLLTEIHLLGYKLQIHSQSAHATLMETYNRAVQNVTVCVSSKIKEATQDSCKQCVTVSPEVPAEISAAYEELMTIIEISALYYPEIVYASLLNSKNLLDQINITYSTYVLGTRVTDARRYLSNTAGEFNVAVSCVYSDDVTSVVDSSVGRAFRESQQLESDLRSQYDVVIAGITHIMAQTESISLEMKGCSEGNSCNYLLTKIVSTAYDVLWQVEQLVYSATATFPQAVTAARESAARIERDLVEQFEIGTIHYKNCIQNSFK